MKSLLIRLMPAALLCLALTACGGGGAVGQTPYDPETAAQALLDSGAFSDALDTVDQDTAAALYGIDADTITGSAVYTSLSAGAEEIAVLVLTDEDAAAAALDGLEARVADPEGCAGELPARRGLQAGQRHCGAAGQLRPAGRGRRC